MDNRMCKKILCYEKWKVEVDPERTANFYKNYKVDTESQVYRNYELFCETLTDEEKNFFSSFGWDPLKCNVVSQGLTKDNTFPTLGNLYFAGKIIERPRLDNEFTYEELVDLVEGPDPNIYIGRLTIGFFDTKPDYVNEDDPQDFDGVIALVVEKMPWLLDEKCERIFTPPPILPETFHKAPHQGERPFDYPPARWVSETPSLWFDVNSPDEYADGLIELEGRLEQSEQSIEIIIWFDYTDKIIISEKNNDANCTFLKGTCKFNPDKLIVTIDKEIDTLLNGQYDTITFMKKPTK